MIRLHKIDLHIHTVHSGDSPCEVEEAIQTAKEKGLSGIAITDHNSVEGLDEALSFSDDEFLVIPGVEVSSEDGHILGLGIEDKVESYLPAAETVDRIREKGGIAVSAHPFSLNPKPFSPLRANFDAIEVFNPRRYLGNRLAKHFATEEGLPMTGGSDAHYAEEIGMAGVEVGCNLELTEVLKEIKLGKANVFGEYFPLTGYWRRIIFRVP